MTYSDKKFTLNMKSVDIALARAELYRSQGSYEVAEQYLAVADEIVCVCAEEISDEILRGHPWNFAMARAKLARATETPEFGFSYFTKNFFFYKI